MKKMFFAICLALSFNAHALKFETQHRDSGWTNIFLTGTLERGDSEKFKALVIKYPANKLLVFFDSPGGDIYEGIIIGSILNDRNIRTGIENRLWKRASCESACALAYLGSTQKMFSKNSSLGVHRFYTKNATAGNSRQAVTRVDEQETQEWTSYIYKYARWADIHPEAIDLMFETPNSTMYYFSRKQMEKYGATYLD